MWEQRLSTAHGGFSVRSIITYALAALIAAFLWIVASPQDTFAADVEWTGSSITYDGNLYAGPASEQTVTALNLPKDTNVYTYVEPTGTTNRKIHILYFAPGVDPGTADGVNYRTHPYSGPNNFGSPSSAQALTLDPSTANVGTNSCVVEGGLGWIICPVTNTLAGFMDWIFDVLVGFLTVRPIDTSQENAMYRAWGFMRTFANIAFVIAFLIIIYSQLTSFGVSNYGIKKLLPRIIIAALLVNLSFIICALAIDISNVLGHSIQNLFIQMRNGLVGTEGNTWDVLSWESMASFILSGGTLLTAGSIAAFSSIATYGVIGSIALLLPALVTLLVAVLVALLVMAGRQAIITILTILAPLAFVAYLLPNTEKWFDKWRGLFMTMLILFPAFSVIFGGSQLAGILIIQNADSINLIILGMIVQVAPLFVTPFLIKFSGSLLGRIAGMVNNPNKGIIDRTRNFAKDRADNIKARRLGTPATSRWQIAKRAGQRLDHNRRRREGWRNAHNAMADASWANSRDFSDLDQRTREAADRKTVGENQSALRYDRAKVTNASLQQLDVDVRQVKLNLENAQLNAEIENWERNHTAPVMESKLRQRVLKDTQSALHAAHDAEYDVQKSDAYQNTTEYRALSSTMRSLVDDSRVTAENLAIQGIRSQSAKNVKKGDIARALEASQTLREVAGAQIIDPYGALRAEAGAVSELKKIDKEAIDNQIVLLNQQAQAKGTTVKFYTKDIINETISGARQHDKHIIEAALEFQASTESDISLLEAARQSANIDQSMLSEVFSRNVPNLKAKGGFHLQLKPDLANASDDVMNANRIATLGDTSANLLANLKYGWVKDLADVHLHGMLNNGSTQDLQKAYNNVYQALNNPDVLATIGDREDHIRDIEAALAIKLGKIPTPRP
ncbi:hypothetical protein B7Y92_02865 [Candidatus Saccharibacteria bacterium 32-50-13]|nr:MAG: hypothetical protein B7Y92_02865 [Candidatus Saccharibacteria bacterium 32-50-13]